MLTLSDNMCNLIESEYIYIHIYLFIYLYILIHSLNCESKLGGHISEAAPD